MNHVNQISTSQTNIQTTNTAFSSKANTMIGVGLRHNHYTQALSAPDDALPVDFVEVHAENFFAKGGASIGLLQHVAQKYQLSIHGTSLGLGSQSTLPTEILSQFTELVNATNPSLVSEHLCFNRAHINGQLVHSSDLLPIAYTQPSLDNIISNITHLQDAIKRPILIENLSAYLSPEQITPALHDQQMAEFEFLITMCQRSGCGLLLDLNNLIINEFNRNTSNPIASLAEKIREIPSHLVGEIHLAGYTEQTHGGFIIDDHGAKVSEQCWQLFESAIQHFDGCAVLVEWDSHIPEWDVLVNEAKTASNIVNKYQKEQTA